MSEIWARFIIILNEIVIKIIMKIALGDLILHDDGIWNAVNNCSSLLFEELDILGLVKACVPGVCLTILTSFNNEDYLFALHR